MRTYPNLSALKYCFSPNLNSHAETNTRDPPFPCAKQTWGLAKLDELLPGLAAEAIAAGREVDTLHLTWPSGETIWRCDMRFIAHVMKYPFIGITRYALQKVLLGHLDDDDLELGARLERFETNEVEEITELRFEGHADPVRARAVIGADGRR